MPNIPARTDYTHDPEMHNNAWNVAYPTRGDYIRDVERIAAAWSGGKAGEFVAVMADIAEVAYDGEYGEYVDEITFDGWEMDRALGRIDNGRMEY